MNKKLLKELKEKLEKEHKILEGELKSFAKKDPKIKGNWLSRFPKFNKEAGGDISESAANQVEEYSARLPIEHSLEIRLRDVNLALKKIKASLRTEGVLSRFFKKRGWIKKREYGICGKCGKKIPIERLKVYPEARLCIKCGEK